MSNTNILGNKGAYHATVCAEDGTCWGFNVRDSHGPEFTMDLANMILDFANTEYKKGCPTGYSQTAYNPNVVFDEVRLDMTNYEDETIIIPTGDEIRRPVGKKKIGKYWKKQNVLRIIIDDVPVYENDNGKICRDSEAIIDSMLIWNGGEK